MNKKFLSAIMCGAMLTASTSVFVSCEDYGDDIAHLQEQIDQNATTAASELAAKVAALESQLSTLKAAQDNMKEQLASAKAEAAAAANNALSAAQAAQAAADKAQSGAADAKAAADKAQATADAANKALSDAVTKVAVLEAKIASLETTIAELSASNKELNTKLNDLQNAYNLLNVNVNANAEEIKAIKADIAAKTAELAGQIAAVSSELAGKIDAIDARLKAVEATYAKVAELAALEAKLDEQIAANEAYVAAMEATIADLEAADAAAAALIAANHEEALAKIAAVNEELAAQKAEVAKNFEAVNAQIADLEATVATLAQLATANYNDIAALRQALDETTADLYDLVSQLAATDRALNEQVVAILEALFTLEGDVTDQISQLAATDRGFQAEFETIWGILDELNTASKDAADQISQLIGADKGFAAQIEALLVDYTTNKELVAQQIINLSKADKDLKDDIVALMGDVEGLYAKLTSAVADLQAVDAKLAEQIKALFAQAEIFGKDIETLKEGIIALQKKDDQIVGMIKVVIADLAGVEKDAADNLAAAVAALEETIADNKDLADEALAALEKALTDKIDANYAELVGEIANAMAKIDELNNVLNTNNVAFAALKADVESLFARLQSVVFIPQYKDVNNVVITPIYAYTAETYDAEGEPMDVPAIFKVNFRVKPASLVSDFVAMANNGEALVNIYVEEALKNLDTRAADKESIQVINIAQDENDAEVITVTATAPRLNTELNETAYFPATLVISAENSKSEFTTEYFNLVERSLDAELPGVLTIKEGVELEIPYVDIDANRNVLEEVEVSYSDAINNVYGQDLYLFGGVDKDGNYVALSDEFVTWAATKGFALKDGLLSAATVNDVAMHHCIGETLTLIVADATYGYDADGLPNVSYEVTYELTAATADETIVFETVSKTWAGAADSEAFTLSTTTDLVDFTVEGVTVATKKELAAELAGLSIDKFTWTNTAVCSDFYLAYDQTNATVTIHYNFAAGTDYNTEGEIAFTAETKYGKVNFKGAIKLAYPEASNFLAHEPRFNDAGDFIVEAGNQVLATAYRDGLVGSSLPAAYTNYAKYTAPEFGAVYTFTYAGAANTELSINSDDYLTILDELADEAGVEITATVTIDGNVVATETYGVDVLYPVEGRNLKLNGTSINENMQTIDAATLYGEQTVSVIGNVFLDDRYNNVLVQNGVFVDGVIDVDGDAITDTKAAVWGITGLKYSLKKAYTETTQRTVTSVSVDEYGNLSIVDPNISENIIVEVEVQTVGYTYGVVNGTFKVLIEKTYGEYPANVE